MEHLLFYIGIEVFGLVLGFGITISERRAQAREERQREKCARHARAEREERHQQKKRELEDWWSKFTEQPSADGKRTLLLHKCGIGGGEIVGEVDAQGASFNGRCVTPDGLACPRCG